MRKLKKIIKFAIIVIVISVIAVIGIGIGKGYGRQGNAGSEETVQEETVKDDDEENTSENSVQEKDFATATDERETVVKISVVGNEYFYENKRIALDDLIAKISGLDEAIVEVRDDNASLREYNNLIDRLTELKIPFKEY